MRIVRGFEINHKRTTLVADSEKFCKLVRFIEYGKKIKLEVYICIGKVLRCLRYVNVQRMNVRLHVKP